MITVTAITRTSRTRARSSCWCRWRCWRRARRSPAWCSTAPSSASATAITATPTRRSGPPRSSRARITTSCTPCTRSRNGSAGRRSRRCWPASALAYLYYIQAPWLPAATARVFRPLYLFLLNKWYFDELYDWLFVRPALWIGRALWKGGDGAIIDGAIDGTASGVVKVTNRVVKLQTGYVYHLRLLDADRRRGDHHVVHAERGSRPMIANGYLLSLVTFLPLAGALIIVLQNEKAVGNIAADRALDHGDHLRPVAADLVELRQVLGGVPVRRGRGLARRRSTTRWASTASRCCS